jgi:GNAT acetyltransferase-like protein
MESLQRYGFRTDVLGCWQGERLIGGALFRTYTIPYSPVTITECLNGPIFLEWQDAWAKAFVEAAGELAERVNSTIVRIQECADLSVHQSVVAAFQDGGQRMSLQPGTPDAVLPLEGRSPDQIWKGYNHGIRQRIKKAWAGGIAIRRLEEPEDLRRAYGAWTETASRKSFSAIRPYDSLEPVMLHCLGQGLGSVLASYRDDSLLAAVFISHVGDSAFYVYGGYVDGADRQSPTHVLHDEAIRESHGKGLARYNFGSLLSATQPEARGVDEFKLGFGAEPQCPLDTIVWQRRPLLYAATERIRSGRLGRRLEAALRQVVTCRMATSPTQRLAPYRSAADRPASAMRSDSRLPPRDCPPRGARHWSDHP